MFDMTNDSQLFRTREQLETGGAILDGNVFTRGAESWLPLYEAKMVDFYDHRRAHVVLSATAAVRQAQPEYLTSAAHENPDELPLPRCWVANSEVDSRLAGWDRDWLVGLCDITSATNERTVIPSLIPRAGVGNNLPLVLALGQSPDVVATLVGVLSSFPADYVARFKVGGVHLNFFLVEQFAVPGPGVFDGEILGFMTARLLELTYTAADLAGFAVDLDYDGPPFRWESDRRALIRAEIDAAMFRLYGIERNDVVYIMETFPIVRRHDEERFGEYRTKRLILERYDALVAADASGVPYETPLDPPPGDPLAAHRAPETTTVS
jgi:hypothetical protein